MLKNVPIFANIIVSAAKGYLPTANQTLTTGVWTKIDLTAKQYDYQDEFDIVNKKFIAKRPAILIAAGKISYYTNTSNRRGLEFKVNGATYQCHLINALSIGSTLIFLTIPIKVAANDEIELYGLQESGGDLDVICGSTTTYMEIVKVVDLD